jgi:hypothetical protein
MRASDPSDETAQPTAEPAQTARRDRDRQLAMSERLERVHQLCAQLAKLKPLASSKGR